MGARRAFASDFDGTIWFNVDGRWTYLKEDMEAMRSFQRGGGLFGISTGRTLNGIEAGMRLVMAPEDLVRFDFYILVNGACIRDADHTPILMRYAPVDALREIHTRYAGSARAVVQANDTVYTFEEPLSTQTRVNGFEDIPGKPHGISLWFGDTELCRQVAKDISKEYAGALVAYANRQIVDVVPAGCSKGVAIRVVREHFGVERVAAIGDSYNDVPMLEAADASYTFPRAPREVQDLADNVVETASDAIAHFCMLA